MVDLHIESWGVVIPGVNSKEELLSWLKSPESLSGEPGKMSLKNVPPMLRRRFGTLGKYAVAASLQILKGEEAIPSVFASRHGNTTLTLSLLEEMGRGEPMSPTGFSLAVHNAVSGLYSIARKDTSMVTSLAVIEGLVLHALLEAAGQLQVSDRVLCVIYDIPLPGLYRRYCTTSEIPYAIALIMGRSGGETYVLEQCEKVKNISSPSEPQALVSESFSFLELLAGTTTEMEIEVNGAAWHIKKVVT